MRRAKTLPARVDVEGRSQNLQKGGGSSVETNYHDSRVRMGHCSINMSVSMTRQKGVPTIFLPRSYIVFGIASSFLRGLC